MGRQPRLTSFSFFLLSISLLNRGVEIIRREQLLGTLTKPLQSLWTDYPHTEMSYLFKFYFIIQIAYWLHAFPEFYFQVWPSMSIL